MFDGQLVLAAGEPLEIALGRRGAGCVHVPILRLFDVDANQRQFRIVESLVKPRFACFAPQQLNPFAVPRQGRPARGRYELLRIDADALRSEKLRVLRSIDPIDADDVVFGQYAAGEIDGQSVPGYRDEPGVADDSPTDTYVAMKLSIDNWRWHGVPFFLRTGKRMGRKASEIAVTFRAPPVCLFEPIGPCDVQADVLRLRLQPNEGVSLAFDVKLPGEPLELRQQRLDFRYADAFGDVPPAYETLLADVIAGDQTHFVRADEVEAAWRIYTPVLENRRRSAAYRAGSFGPSAADKLVEKYGCAWIAP